MALFKKKVVTKTISISDEEIEKAREKSVSHFGYENVSGYIRMLINRDYEDKR